MTCYCLFGQRSVCLVESLMLHRLVLCLEPKRKDKDGHVGNEMPEDSFVKHVHVRKDSIKEKCGIKCSLTETVFPEKIQKYG